MLRNIETIALAVFGVLGFFLVVGLIGEFRDLGQRVNARVALLAAVSK